MFTNEYKDSFGKIYTSGVYEKAQTTNKWSLAYTLLYALSKNGMKYATDTTGKCSVINNTSLGCKCQIVVTGPTATSGSLIITFKQICVKINVVTNLVRGKFYAVSVQNRTSHYELFRSSLVFGFFTVMLDIQNLHGEQISSKK